MSLWFNESGYLALCENGYVAETDDCPCGGCPSFVGRTITYVDKKATGTGGGSSWANAYTSIQDAIDAKPKTEIQIQGYGEFDAYPALNGINLIECTYINGINDVWIDLQNRGVIIGLPTTKLDNINAINGSFFNYTFSGCYNLTNCYIKNSSFHFGFCQFLEDCGGDENIAFTGCNFINNCNGSLIFNTCAEINNCISNNQTFFLTSTFFNCEHIYNCKAIGGTNDGFSSCNDLVNCDAQYNQRCGFQGSTSLVDCTSSNNCLSNSQQCIFGSIGYICEEP